MTNGNILTGWKVPFGMPYQEWSTGSTTWSTGWVDTRFGESWCYDLSGLYHGQEVIMNDIMVRYCATNGSRLNGTGKWYSKVVSPTGAVMWWFYENPINIDIEAPSSGYHRIFYQGLGVAGIDESDEFHTNGTICFFDCVTANTGDDVSIPEVAHCGTITNAPTLCDTEVCGAVWVDGVNLYYTGARGWRHFLCGDCCGWSCCVCPGAIWIEGNILRWTGSDGTTAHSAPWELCQFESCLTGPGPNPSPGSDYAGAIWADRENHGGWVELAYIGSDGNKYLVGQGNRPDQAPS